MPAVAAPPVRTGLLASSRAALWAVLVVALVVRIAVVGVAAPDYRPLFDAADYDRHAESIAAGHGYPDSALLGHGPTAFRPPVYPYFLGAVYAVTGQRWTAGLLAAAVLGTLVVLLIYLVAERLWGRRVALVSAALAAVFPPLVTLGAALLSEPLFLVIELGLVLAVLAFRRSADWRFAAAAGLLAGLGALTRANGVLLVIPAIVGVWTARPLLGRRALVAPAAVLLAAALAIAPWTVRNAFVFDRFVPVSTQAGFGLSGTYNDISRGDERYPARWRHPRTTAEYGSLFRRPGLDEAELDAKLRRGALDYVADDPPYVAESLWWNTLRMFDLARRHPADVSGLRRERGLGRASDGVVVWSGYGIELVALGGVLILLALPRGRRGPIFPWLIPPLMVVGAIAILGNSRYRAPVEPFLVFLAAIALVGLWEKARSA
jgi:4-amino-4-deoxy-L-arabinose transferase-like glycosyltransferase